MIEYGEESGGVMVEEVMEEEVVVEEEESVALREERVRCGRIWSGAGRIGMG